MEKRNPAHNGGAGFGLSGGQADFTSPIKFLHAKNHNQQSGFTHLALADLSSMAKTPRVGSKNTAPCFAPHDGNGKTKDAALAAQFNLLILDFDYGGHDAVSIPDLLRDVAFLAWTSSSHTAENPRWKAVIPLSRPIGATAWIPIAGGAALFYGADPAQARVQQISYVPNKLTADAPYEYIDRLNDGELLNPTESIAQAYVAAFDASREQVAAKATPKPPTAPKGSTDIVRMTNQAYDVRSILESNGYQKRGKKYLAPNSKSGFPGVHILAGDDGRERVYSHHSSDVLADGHLHDSFDLLVEFRFHGNVTEAVKVLAAELDGDANRQRQRDYMAAQDAAPSAAKTNDEGDEADYLTPPPTMRLAMLYGLIGDIATKASEGREVNAVSVALAAIVRLSALVGRDVYIQIGDERHTLNQFGLHVGRSALGAKGESFALLRRIESKLAADKINGETILGQSHTAGLSSREGLAGLIHDGYRQGKEEVPAIDDKRAFLRESEFANLLAQSKRDGNTLSPALRDVWDSGQSIRPLTKGKGLWATDPHIALHGAITPLELREKLSAGEASNGFLNRFLIAFAERTGLVAFPPATKQIDVDILASRVEKIVLWATGNYPLDKYTRKMTLSDEAVSLWKTEYPKLKKRTTHGEMINAILERRAPITLRLAALFAATDMTMTIEAHHLIAALAWAEFHRESVVYIFGANAQAQQKAQQLHDYRTRIIAALASGEWVTRSDLHKAFSGRADTANLDEALAALLADKMIERSEAKNQGNPKKKVSYRLAKNANYAKNAEESGLAGCEFTAKDCEKQNHHDGGNNDPAKFATEFAEIRTEFADEEPRQSTKFAKFAKFAAVEQSENDTIIDEVEI